jgi:methyl-accepting chemotaxis protein
MLLFLLPLAILAFSYFSEVNRVSKHTQGEIQGLNAFRLLDQQQESLIQLISKDMGWRSKQTIPAQQAGRVAEFIENLPKLANPDLFDPEQVQSLMQSVKRTADHLIKVTNDLGNPQWSAIDRFNHLESGINLFNSLYLKIANLKGLTNDLQVDTVVLSRLIIEKRQLALSLIARSYGVAAYAVGEKQVSSGTFDSLSLVNDNLASSLIKIQNLAGLADDLDNNLQALVKQDTELLVSIVDESILFIEEQFLIAEEVVIDESILNRFYSEKLTKYYQNKQLLKNELQARLELRLNEIQTNRLTILFIVALVLLVVVYLFVGMSLSISMTTNNLANIAEKLADGDTRVSVEVKTKDELSNAINAFNRMAKNVHSLVESVQNASQGVAQQSEDVKQLANQTGDAVSKQLQDTQAITTATSDLLSAVATVSHNTQQVMNALEQATQQTQKGRETLIGARKATNELGEEIKHSVTVINHLSQQSDSINQVLDVIKSIADQTNLLALNAAIEAARAGEQGRGFAVVADEVRTLEKRTRESTDEIQTTISSLQKGVSDAVDAMTRSDEKANRSIEESAKLDDALNLITQAVEQIGEQNTATEQASQQQTEIASQIENRLNSISQISTVTENNAQQSISASQKLAEHVARLEAVVANFKT